MLILASRSPQRRAILASIGVDFRVVVADVQEGHDPLENARRKAVTVAGQHGMPPRAAVLGCDTEVILDGVALGKPRDRRHASGMLCALSGRRHEVRSAVVLVRDGDVEESEVVTAVRMRVLGEPLLEWYLDTGEWRERAGAYAIQGAGAALIAEIRGDYSGVVGLPIGAVLELLERRDLAPWSARPVQ